MRARFRFRAMGADGSERSGLVEADSVRHAEGLLRAKGMSPFELREAEGGAKGASPAKTRGVPSPLDLELFCQQMSSMLKSGLPLLAALDAARESCPEGPFEAALDALRSDLDGGFELSVCLARQPAVFDAFFVAMVRAAEQSGGLDGAFSRLLAHMEFRRRMSERVRAATRYPLTLLATMAVAIGVVNYVVIPAFAKAYASFGAKLPVFTRLLIAVSGFMVERGGLVAGIAVAAALGFRHWVRSDSGRLSWDRLKLRLPVFGPLARKAALSRFSRSFALSYAAGVPVNQAISLVSATAGNAWVVSRLSSLRPAIERGESLHRAALATGEFTPVALQMLRLGEESGRLDEMMGKVADLYEEDVERDLRDMASKIEPILVAVMGVFVLVMALGIFLPIWSFGEAAGLRR